MGATISETILQGKPLLLNRYNLLDELNYIQIMHPAHLTYIQGVHYNTMDYFFECLDELDELKRNEITHFLWFIIIRPRRRIPKTGRKSLDEIYIDKVDYYSFKDKCYETVERGKFDRLCFTYFLVSYILQSLFSSGDITKIEERVRGEKQLIESLNALDSRIELDKKSLTSGISLHMEIIRELPEQINTGYELYLFFCENILEKLLVEDLIPDFSMLEGEMGVRDT